MIFRVGAGRDRGAQSFDQFITADKNLDITDRKVIQPS